MGLPSKTHTSPDVVGADVIGGLNFALYGGFTFLPHVPEVIARQGFHVFPIPDREVSPLWCDTINLYLIFTEIVGTQHVLHVLYRRVAVNTKLSHGSVYQQRPPYRHVRVFQVVSISFNNGAEHGNVYSNFQADTWKQQ